MCVCGVCVCVCVFRQVGLITVLMTLKLTEVHFWMLFYCGIFQITTRAQEHIDAEKHKRDTFGVEPNDTDAEVWPYDPNLTCCYCKKCLDEVRFVNFVTMLMTA